MNHQKPMKRKKPKPIKELEEEDYNLTKKEKIEKKFDIKEEDKKIEAYK